MEREKEDSPHPQQSYLCPYVAWRQLSRLSPDNPAVTIQMKNFPMCPRMNSSSQASQTLTLRLWCYGVCAGEER